MMYGMSGSRLKNDEFYSYDKMGNITSLYRLEEAGTVNGLDIHYRGNQLLKVTDDNKSFHGTYDFAIYPDLADSEQEYYYDGNGLSLIHILYIQYWHKMERNFQLIRLRRGYSTVRSAE